MALELDDLRAAVAAGVLSEPQAARLIVLGQSRAGQRAGMALDDEPFELFRGFAEIFVSVGIVLLFSGIMVFAGILDTASLPAVAAALAWVFGIYFIRKRRMALPSIVLTIAYALGAGGMLWLILDLQPERLPEGRGTLVLFCLMGLAGLAVWYRAFKVPFTMLLAGVMGAALVYLLVDAVRPYNDLRGLEHLFDLRSGSGLAIATLIFGLIAFAAGLLFDMRDPHRLGRWSASGFWLHILAAPALVNTIALTAYNTGGLAGNLWLAVALVAVSVLALVIDRRSFLTAGFGYVGVLVAWAIQAGDNAGSFALLLLILGAFLTFMGTFWTQMRARLMRALPEFPGKRSLPPYTEF
ncbi:MAG: hypothetical protein Q7J57_01525 [Gemmobacter sp.]|nr:hypothetical protein [Gemmobacter sp.]